MGCDMPSDFKKCSEPLKSLSFQVTCRLGKVLEENTLDSLIDSHDPDEQDIIIFLVLTCGCCTAASN